MNGTPQQVIAGFIPLLDSAVLVAAAEYGFAEEAGIDLRLIRETSWANIRDRIAVGHFDVAHMLAPMPIAASLRLTSLAVPMRAAMTLAHGGNAITVSSDIAKAMADEGWPSTLDPAASGAALARVVRKRAQAGEPPLQFGVVHPFSGHAYELRYWLSAAGIDPERDVSISVLPPPVMPDALAHAQIDGYCVGEPWSTVAVQAGTGTIVTCKQAIWPESPEKTLGVTDKWMDANPDTFAALMRALSQAADWCAETENAPDLAKTLSAPEYLGCKPDVILPALAGPFQIASGKTVSEPQIIRFGGGEAATPQPVHGLWLYSQMVRWGQAAFDPAHAARVPELFNDTAYREALDLAPATDDLKSAPVTLFDGRTFDPAHLREYVETAAFRTTLPAS